MNPIVRGGLAGLLGTVTMSGVIAGGRAARLLWTPPPAEITDRAARKAGAEGDRRTPAFQVGWITAHLAYGAACGVLYALGRPSSPPSTVGAGLIFGGAVWGVSYLGVMPALGLYPWPEDDSKSRLAVIIAAHAVFGTTVAEADRRLSAR